MPAELPEDFSSFMAITTRPELLDQELVKRVNTALIMSETPARPDHAFICPYPIAADHAAGRPGFAARRCHGVAKSKRQPRLIRRDTPNPLVMRHKRKYATGNIGINSFYFNGPAHRMNLKANNLMLFIQIGTGVDDETWSYHLGRHDYSNWFRHSVKDEKLALRAEKIEDKGLNPSVSRNAIF